MNSRYQLKALFAEQNGVNTYEGVDSLTGLPVLIYQYIGRNLATLMNLESENIPGILASQQDGEQAQVVVAYSKNYRSLSVPISLDINKLLVGSARALKDAAQAGIVHGDIRPARFMASGDHVLLEGFGMPWQVADDGFRPPEASSGSSFAGDVYAWAKSLLHLSDGQLRHELKGLLNACLAPNPNERPAASELYSSLKAVSTAAPSNENVVASEVVPAASPPGLEPIELDFVPEPAKTVGGETEPEDFMAFFGKQNVPESPAEESHSKTSRAEEFSEEFFDEHVEDMREARGGYKSDIDEVASEPPMTVSDLDERDPLSVTPPEPAGVVKRSSKFVKDLPPGATYHAGEASNSSSRPGMFEEYSFDDVPNRQPRDLRRIILLGLFLVGVAILAYLVTRQDLGRDNPVTTTTQERVRYPVEVQIGPASLPPVEIVVVQSPTGSTLLPNTVVGRFSPGTNNIVLDKDGLWQLQARFQDRISEPVTFELPQQRNIALTLPEAPQEE